jgi:4-amino-4-deoxy-L-arabinose transferase-like glycosyltransferase
MIDYWTRGWKPYLLLVVLCLSLQLPGLRKLPPTDRDESRFAQASRQMLESGNYLDIRFQEEPRYRKPIGIYWLQAAAAAATVGPETPAIWAYRLPSVLGALLAVLFTFHFGRTLFDRRSALLGAALLASCLLLTTEAHLAKTDAMLLAAIAAMQGSLGRIYLLAREGRDPGPGSGMVFWGACGAGILLKGPVPGAIAVLTLAALWITDRKVYLLRALRPKRGLILLAAIVLPWFLAISLSTHGEFVKTAVMSDLLPKLLSGQESHGAPPGYYAALFTALFWPGSIFAFWALWPSWKCRKEPAVRFCLAWIVPAWMMFELVPTKLPHYILPVFPAIALLTAHFLISHQRWSGYLLERPFNIIKWVPMVLWVLVGIALAAGLTALPLVLSDEFAFGSIPAVFGILAVIFLAGRAWRAGQLPRAALIGVFGSLFVFGAAFHWILPGIPDLWISEQVARVVQKHDGANPPRVASVGFEEPSLVFLLGTATTFTNPDGAVTFLKGDPRGLVLVRDRYVEEFASAAGREGVGVHPLATIRGFNYPKGKWLTLSLFAGAKKTADMKATEIGGKQ